MMRSMSISDEEAYRYEGKITSYRGKTYKYIRGKSMQKGLVTLNVVEISKPWYKCLFTCFSNKSA